MPLPEVTQSMLLAPHSVLEYCVFKVSIRSTARRRRHEQYEDAQIAWTDAPRRR